MMHKTIYLFLLLLFVLATSCIPNKDLIYFQGQPQIRKTVYKMADEPYKLQVNDILDIKINSDDEKLVAVFNRIPSDGMQTTRLFNQENLYFTAYSVDRDGTVEIPYIGRLNVLGYTEKEVQVKIQDELTKYFKDTSSIFVTVKLGGIRYTVLGEVAKPGTVILYQNQVNIAEAIANAGDITLTGNRRSVSVIRKGLGQTQKFSLDLTDINLIDSANYYIQPNDIIIVDPLKQKSWGTGTNGVQTFTTIVSIVSFIATTILLVRNF